MCERTCYVLQHVGSVCMCDFEWLCEGRDVLTRVFVLLL